MIWIAQRDCASFAIRSVECTESHPIFAAELNRDYLSIPDCLAYGKIPPASIIGKTSPSGRSP